MRKLNLGCGRDIKEGYINLDSLNLPKVDQVHDLNEFPYPFEENHFEEIYADNILEHLDDLVKVMEELYRILKPGGKLIAIVPYFSSAGAFQDPTHKRFFGLRTMNYFSKDFLYYYNSKADFRVQKKKLRFRFRIFKWIFGSPETAMRVYEALFAFIIPALDIHFELEAIK